jgi:hypothetical protein
MGSALHSLFEFPLEDAISRFVEMREAYLKTKAERTMNERRRMKEGINAFADEVLDRISDVRQFHPMYRMRPMSLKLLPIRHRYDMHELFPCLVSKIPAQYGELGVQFDSDQHLNELEEAVCKERALALALCCE